MWMIKSKFGGTVWPKMPTAYINEVLAKVLCHNMICIIWAPVLLQKGQMTLSLVRP